jgi:hypothetical protein
MSKTRSRKRVEEHDSDDGFIEDAAPKNKKQKKVVSGQMQKDDEGNEYWEVGRYTTPQKPCNVRHSSWQCD